MALIKTNDIFSVSEEFIRSLDEYIKNTYCEIIKLESTIKKVKSVKKAEKVKCQNCGANKTDSCGCEYCGG